MKGREPEWANPHNSNHPLQLEYTFKNVFQDTRKIQLIQKISCLPESICIFVIFGQFLAFLILGLMHVDTHAQKGRVELAFLSAWVPP